MNEKICTANRKDGEPCQADFGLFEDGRCWHHSQLPAVVEQRAKARARGGISTAKKYTRQRSTFDPDDLPPLDSLAAAQTWLETVGRLRAEGRLSHNDVGAYARLVSEWVKAEGSRAVSEEVEALRARLEALEGGKGPQVMK